MPGCSSVAAEQRSVDFRDGFKRMLRNARSVAIYVFEAVALKKNRNISIKINGRRVTLFD